MPDSKLHDNPFIQFSCIYCISLKRCAERRRHIKAEFLRIGAGKFNFIDAYDKDSRKVTQLFLSDFVKKYPPCFRCGQESCSCSNKSLFRAQIGNWLSHMKAWKMISTAGEKLALVCEDDVKFLDNIHQSLIMVAESEEVIAKLKKAEPVLVRLGWALCEEHKLCSEPELTQDIKMSNPCYAINPPMARLLLDSLHEINTTSDVYLHRIIGSTVNHYSVLPPTAYELSWSTGQVVSEIRPKEIRLSFLLGKLNTLDQQDPEYSQIKVSYEEELLRLKQFEAFDKPA